MAKKSFKNQQVYTIWCLVHLIPGGKAKQDGGSYLNPNCFFPMTPSIACAQAAYGSWSDFLLAWCIFFLLTFHRSTCVLVGKKYLLKIFCVFFLKLSVKRDLKSQGMFMENKCVYMCVCKFNVCACRRIARDKFWGF